MRFLLAAAIFQLALAAIPAEPPPWTMGLHTSMDQVLSIGPGGKNGVVAARGAQRLGTLPPAALFSIFEGFEHANPLAANLLRTSVETIADRAAASNSPLPTEGLAGMLNEPGDWDPRARRLAYELLLHFDPSAAKELLPGLITDPNPELRRDAVAHWMAVAKGHRDANEDDEARKAYETALGGAIDDDQVRPIVTALETYGIEVDLPRHFGFITHWQVIGPFDNRGNAGFNAVYPPETAYSPAKGVDLEARYEGQLADVGWKPISTESDYGIIDIARTFENYKGSAMYLVTTIESDEPQDVEFRLGTQNAWKLWLNGEFLFGREEYHRGMIMDQHRIAGRLKSGNNVLLMKLLQNEQDEDWAQSYNFQLRITDPTGRAVPAAESE